ncbi:MAG: murein biosynthesis integral membrane protein MurJ [Streptosporangiaceae bacterium]
MTEPAPPVTEDTPERAAGPGPAIAAGIGRAAALIAVLTICARLLGLVRQVVFAHTVEAYCLGTAYTTANQVPNIIYDIVLGGALTSVMVPLLARSAQRVGTDAAAARQVTQTSSALLTWTVVILAPVSLLIAVAAGPIASVLSPANPAGHCGHASMITLTSRMITVFVPQVLCYGLAVALYGILQAHRRFTAPALAPVISSLVVMAAYLLFVPFGAGHREHVAGLPVSAELILAAGTTLGVAALALTALVPAVALRLRLRPTLRFPAGVARQARGLAGYGIAALIAQDAALLVVIRLANGSATQGAVVLYGYGWQAFESIYAVLAVPIVISVFPVLSGSDSSEFDETSAGSSRAVLLMSFLGAALLAAVATPAARVFAGHGQVLELALGFAAFAPGLIGYGLMACLSRVLLASGRNAIAAAAMVGGWLAVIGADLVLVHLASPRWVVAALGLGNTIGFTIAAVALVLAVRRVRGPSALRAMARATVAGLAAGLAGAAAGGAVGVLATHGRHSPPLVLDGVAAALAAVCATAVFGGVAYVLDGGELRAALGRVRRTATR